MKIDIWIEDTCSEIYRYKSMEIEKRNFRSRNWSVYEFTYTRMDRKFLKRERMEILEF